jgi:hypothetical protein
MEKLTKNININANISSATINDTTGKYYMQFNKIPDLFMINDVYNTNKVTEFLKNKGFSIYKHTCMLSIDDKDPYIYTLSFEKESEIMISCDSAGIYIMYSEKSDIKYFIDELLNKKYLSDKVKEKQLCVIVPERNSYRTTYHKLKRADFNPINYNQDFNEIHESIKKTLNEDRSGLYLFYGKPGTGKSSYIASLTNLKINKKFIYIPSSMFSQLDSPILMELFLNNKNSVFIIEDAEKLIINRDDNSHSPISALLNMSDGLIGQLLSSQIICTFNTELDKIDKALLRNGRLITMYEFKPLIEERAKSLAKSLDKPFESIKGDTTIADIYNIDNNSKELKPKRTAIGFSKR